MKKNFWIFIGVLFLTIQCTTQKDKVTIVKNEKGVKLVVKGKDFMIKGMNWDYFPIGTNYTYSLWTQPDSIVKKALDYEMTLLKNMGVNAIRQYVGVPPKWIEYIYKKYGIYTMINHSFGRYGVELKGAWMSNTNYSDKEVQKVLLSEIKKVAEKYKNTSGLLMYLIGNENNYGLFWEGAETENIPKKNKKEMLLARQMYRLFNKAANTIKNIDATHPVAMCNGDLLFIDIIANECKDVDIFGVNMYRGISFGNAFEEVKNKLNKPILFTELGADAFNAITKKEDQTSQAYYMVGNWKEIYENAAGLGKAENAIGGFTFQFSDGWWKHLQTQNLDVHDTHASWANGGYKTDYKKGENNMNEEWFGICAKEKPNTKGLYKLQPRDAYYALQKVHRFHPYEKGTTIDVIEKYFLTIYNNTKSNIKCDL